MKTMMETSAIFNCQSRDWETFSYPSKWNFLDNSFIGPNIKKGSIIHSCTLNCPVFGSKDAPYLVLFEVCSESKVAFYLVGLAFGIPSIVPREYLIKIFSKYTQWQRISFYFNIYII